MTAREYAAHRDVSISYVHRMRRKGHVVCDGKGRILVAETDRRLDSVLDPVRGGKGGGVAARAVPPNAGSEAGDLPAEKLPATVSVHEAVRRERLARAQLAELELGEKAGQLTRVDHVNRAVYTLVRQAVNRMQTMSGRLRAQLAGEADPYKVGEILDTEVAAICAEMRDSAILVIPTDAGSIAEDDDDDAEDGD